MSLSAAAVADRVELRELTDEYGFAADARDPDRFAALFTAEATLSAYALGEAEPVAVYRGERQLRAVVLEVLPRFGASFHLMANRRVRVEGDAAEGEVYCLARHLREGREPARSEVMLMHYRDRYRRVEGRWRIAERHTHRLWDEFHEALAAPPTESPTKE